MVQAYRAMGPRNATLPEATEQVIGFFHDPSKWPYMQYTQLVNVTEDSNGLYRYAVIEPDAPNELINYAEFAWGWDDMMPAGERFKPRIQWQAGETSRYAFGYTLGERTQKAWTNATKINPQQLYDRMRLNHAQLHRASRAVDNVRGASFPAYNTSTLQALLGSPSTPVYWDQSSGTELDVAGNPSAGFQIIKKSVNVIKRRIHLQTNGAVAGEKIIAIIGPKVADRLAECGEIVNYLKQQSNAKSDLVSRNSMWNIPDNMYGIDWVVEDSPRVFLQPLADGTTMADATVATTRTPTGSSVAYNQRDYVWNDDTVVFCSRAGGLDGGYGQPNFSTFQMYYYGGLADVRGETDQWNQLLKGAIVIEDKFESPALISGFKLTGVLSALQA